jgi:hypothetical protein
MCLWTWGWLQIFVLPLLLCTSTVILVSCLLDLKLRYQRYVWKIKERCRPINSNLCFEKISSLIITRMVYFTVFWVNIFPEKHAISSMISPRRIITGFTIDFNVLCKLEFWAYVQTHKYHSDDMKPNTIGAICLVTKGNILEISFTFKPISDKDIH